MRETSGGPTQPGPETAAELLLLLRIALADGPIDERSAAVLRRVAEQHLGLAPEGVDEVLAEIEQLVTDAGVHGLAAVLCSFPAARLGGLCGLLTQLVAGDRELAPLRERLDARIAALLGAAAGRPGGDTA